MILLNYRGPEVGFWFGDSSVLPSFGRDCRRYPECLRSTLHWPATKRQRKRGSIVPRCNGRPRAFIHAVEGAIFATGIYLVEIGSPAWTIFAIGLSATVKPPLS